MVQACEGCEAAYYLIHSMIAHKHEYAAADRRAAIIMRLSAEKAGLKQIIYLGGLGDQDHSRISPHLRSRHEVAAILQSGAVPATVLRAAMISISRAAA